MFPSQEFVACSRPNPNDFTILPPAVLLLYFKIAVITTYQMHEMLEGGGGKQHWCHLIAGCEIMYRDFQKAFVFY